MVTVDSAQNETLQPAKTRAPVAMGNDEGDLVVLCNDGTIFVLRLDGWNELPPIPQPVAARAPSAVTVSLGS